MRENEKLAMLGRTFLYDNKRLMFYSWYQWKTKELEFP